MRPAPRFELPAEEPAEAPAKPSLPPGQKRGLIIGLLIAVVALAGIGIGVWAVITGGPNPFTGGQGAPAATPARPIFVFRIDHVRADRTGRGSAGVAGDASVEIAGRLSSFYDTVFMDPKTWKDGVPDEAWELFDPSIRDRARRDGAAFTLGSQAATLQSMRVEDSSFSVSVLLDPRGNPRAAVATVKFEAVGTFDGGQDATITNEASFLLQPRNGEWVVFGYPQASTSVEAQVPTPSPQTSSSASASASP